MDSQKQTPTPKPPGHHLASPTLSASPTSCPATRDTVDIDHHSSDDSPIRSLQKTIEDCAVPATVPLPSNSHTPSTVPCGGPDVQKELQLQNSGTDVQVQNSGTDVQVQDSGTDVQVQDSGTDVQVQDSGTDVQLQDTGTHEAKLSDLVIVRCIIVNRNADVIKLRLPPQATILEVKTVVRLNIAEPDTALKRLRMFFAGKELADTSSLADYGITSSSVHPTSVHIVVAPPATNERGSCTSKSKPDGRRSTRRRNRCWNCILQ